MKINNFVIYINILLLLLNNLIITLIQIDIMNILTNVYMLKIMLINFTTIYQNR